MKNNKKTVIKLIIALVVLAIAIVTLVLVTKMMNDETQNNESSSLETSTETIAHEGEGIYLSSMLLMYPEIEKSDIASIKIRVDGSEVEFVSRIGDTGHRTLRLKSYPAIRCSDAIANNMYSSMCVPLVRYDSDGKFYVYRDVTEAERIEKGVTEDTCTAEYEITYNVDGGQNTYTVYVGKRTFLSTISYYAAVKGREDVIYIIDNTVESFFGGTTEEFYVSPVVYTGTTLTDTMFLYEDFSINRFKGGSMIGQALGIHATKKIIPNESVSVQYNMMYPTQTAGLKADKDYLANAFTKLLVSFTGDAVMVLEPSEDDLEKYGFGKDDEFYVIKASQYKQTEDPDEVPAYIMFTISEKIGDYYYVYTESTGDKASIDYIPDTIIRVPSATLSFIEDENLIRWVSTNSLETNFYQSISANEAEGKIGVKNMSIIVNNVLIGKDKRVNFNDTFNLEYTKANDDDGRKLRVWLSNNKEIEFVDKEDYESVSERNQFNNFYANLLNYPMPYRFNQMSEDERNEIKADANSLVLSLHVELNDGTKLTYDYYRIHGTEYVMCEFTDETFTEPTIAFDVKMEHVILVAQALDQLMAGQAVEVK